MASSNSRRLTAAEVLHRYKDEDLPAFCGISLQDVNQVGNFGERPLHVASVRGNIGEIAALIDAGAEVNAPGESREHSATRGRIPRSCTSDPVPSGLRSIS